MTHYYLVNTVPAHRISNTHFIINKVNYSIKPKLFTECLLYAWHCPRHYRGIKSLCTFPQELYNIICKTKLTQKTAKKKIGTKHDMMTIGAIGG